MSFVCRQMMGPIDADAASQFLAKHADSVSQNGFLPRHLPLRETT